MSGFRPAISAEVKRLDSRLLEQQAEKLIRVYERLQEIRKREANRSPATLKLIDDAIADLESFGQCYDRGMR